MIESLSIVVVIITIYKTEYGFSQVAIYGGDMERGAIPHERVTVMPSRLIIGTDGISQKHGEDDQVASSNKLTAVEKYL